MAVDALAPWVSRPSTAVMELIVQDELVLVLNKEGFQQPVPFQCWEIIENANIYIYIFKTNQQGKG